MLMASASPAIQTPHFVEQQRALRVVIFSDAAPERNGVGAYYHDLIAHLEDQIEHGELICPDSSTHGWRGRLRFPLPGDATQEIALPPVSRIVRHVIQFKPHAIVIATPGPYGLLGLGLGKHLGTRILIGFHTRYERLTGLYWNRLFNAASRSYFGACNRLLFRHGAVVLANSEDMAEVARREGAREVEIVGTPLSREFLKTPPAVLGGELTRVLFAGRLAAEKNVQAVLEAAKLLPSLEFCIAGHGPLHGVIVDHARTLPNLRYLGWLSRAGLRTALDSADLLVLPSHEEAFGTIALEGLARGRNVLVSVGCGILGWPSLERGLFRIREGEHLASAIQRLVSLDYGLRNEKARLGRQAAVQLNGRTLQRWVDILGRA